MSVGTSPPPNLVRVVRTTAAIIVSMLVLTAWSSRSSPPSGLARARSGGEVTFASTLDVPPNFILPLVSASYASQTNINDFQFLMWRPLYWMGGPGTVGINYNESLAGAPIVANDGSNTKITMTLKRYYWSDGSAVTSRDVEFWINLLKANKAQWWDYQPGEFPDNIVSASYPNPRTVVLVLKGQYDPSWVLNELSQIIPLPQQSWDKKSAPGSVGNYDMTSSGAVAVFNFLAAQNKDLATYATNPIWKTVDGPFVLSSFNPTTFDAVFVPNKHWSGSPKPTIGEFNLETFTSDAAEFNSLRSGDVTYGYVPPADQPQVPELEGMGLVVQPWVQWNINFVSYNFSNPTVGPIFDQLYVRQALQHLVDQPGLIRATLAGDGYPTNGPVPLVPSSRWVSPQEKNGWYAYSTNAAEKLLSEHGWSVKANGTTKCARAGTGPSDCGKGIAAGTPLSLSMMYTTGSEILSEQALALQTSFAAVGIRLELQPESLTSIFAVYYPCSAGKSCPWEMIYDGGGWGFEPTYNIPELGSLLATDGVSNVGAYSDATNDANLEKVYKSPDAVQSVYTYENYLGEQLPLLWMPEIQLQMSAVSKSLTGWSPQQPQLNITPESWKLGS
jgi:peptide/nickel transport system substrate-binding protein